MCQTEFRLKNKLREQQRIWERLNLQPSSRGVFFWHDCTVGFNSQARLPEVYWLNLEAAAAQFEVELWSYQLQRGLPVRVTLCDAREVFPVVEAERMMTDGWRVCHLSDVVRLRALSRSEAGGWFLDLDQLWLNRAIIQLKTDAGFHAAASTRVTKFRGGTRQWLLKYLRVPGDMLYFSVPIHFPARSPLLAQSLIDSLNNSQVSRRLPRRSRFRTLT